MEATRYPLDVRDLRKGDDYDMAALGLLKTAHDDPMRRLELLELRNEIQLQADEAGLCMSLRTKGNRIVRVMTDSEASDYHDDQSANAIRKLGRQVFRMRSNVDRSKLDDQQREGHDRALARRALQYLAVRLPSSKQRTLVNKPQANDHITNRPNPFRKDEE